MTKLEFGLIGLGRMDGNHARHALEVGITVAGYELTGAPADLVEAGLTSVPDLAGFRAVLGRPRAIFLYIPSGSAVDDTLEDLARELETDDVIVDEGNSYGGDSIHRHRRLRAGGIHLVDLGTSGGVDGARRGTCFMAGGFPAEDA